MQNKSQPCIHNIIIVTIVFNTGLTYLSNIELNSTSYNNYTKHRYLLYLLDIYNLKLNFKTRQF